jgi:hypothetical protein
MYKDQNFQAIGLDWYDNSNKDNVQGYKTFTGITYPLCIDASSARVAYQAYEKNDVSMVIDQEGIIRYRGAGVNSTSIKSWIDNLLATNVESNEGIARTSQLYQNYPNPFNPVTNIRFELLKSEQVILQIFDIEGRLIKTLIDNRLFAGTHELSWNGLDDQSRPVASGVYYYNIKAGTYQSARRMVLMR